MIELAWVPFALMLLTFAAYVVENWPKDDPTADSTYERRDMAHVRRLPR
jgi:hypothetical protein